MTVLHFTTQRVHSEGFTPREIEAVSDAEKTGFLKACKAGDLKAVQSYCAQHPKSVNVQNVHGKSGLMFASRSSAYAVVEYLSALPGYAIDMEDENCQNALFDAAAANSAKIVELLLKKGIPVVVSKSGKYAPEALTTEAPSKKMWDLLCKAVQLQENREAVILKEYWKRSEKEMNPIQKKKILAEAEKLVGKKIERLSIAEFDEGNGVTKADFKQTKTSVCEDQITLGKIVTLFQNDPPTSVSAGIEIVQKRFGIKVTKESLERLLAAGQFRKSEKKDEVPEVD